MSAYAAGRSDLALDFQCLSSLTCDLSVYLFIITGQAALLMCPGKKKKNLHRFTSYKDLKSL